MSALLSVTGLLILAIAFTDLFITVLTARGAGPVTGRMTAWIWQGLLALHSRKRTHLFLGIAGPLIAVLTVIGWIVLFWAGWFLIFTAGAMPVVKDGSGEPADSLTVLYFVGYTFFTLGLGDYRPEGGGWRLLTTIIAGNGFLTLSLCQRRLNFPQKCRSKIPQVPGTVISRAGDRPSRFSAAAHGVWVAAAA
jgi:hypothetical protein